MKATEEFLVISTSIFYNCSISRFPLSWKIYLILILEYLILIININLFISTIAFNDTIKRITYIIKRNFPSAHIQSPWGGGGGVGLVQGIFQINNFGHTYA